MSRDGIIATSIIQKPRKSRQCDECRKWIRGKTVRLFGRADSTDTPYPLYLCWECAEGSQSIDLICNPIIHPHLQPKG